MQWFKRFNYETNPFDTDPFNAQITVVNHNELLENVAYLVKSGNILVLEGKKGSGKTIFLRRIIEKFKGQGRVVYIDGNLVKHEPDIEKVLNKKGKQWFGKKPKKMILLFDNFDGLSAVACEKIKYYFDQDFIQSVVFTTRDASKLHLSPSIKDRLLDNIIQVPILNKFDALRIVRERFSDHFFLSDDVVMRLFNQAKHDMKLTLQFCDDLCAFVTKEGRGEALPKYIPFVMKKYKQEGVA